ncbi:MAG: permease component of ABC-type sugar transporter [Clostridia bacterium]|jgi:multiple sugar transport system permease protein|nr:permease component of ABC-type sugar transporter [Clostridia bacterium]
MKKNKVMMVTFLVPAILSYLLVFLYPTMRTTFMSLFYVENITDSVLKWRWVGLGNFKTLADSTLFMQALKNISLIWLWGGVGVFLLSMLFAVILTSGVKGKSFYRSIIYLPNVVSAVAMGTMWMQYVYNPKFGLFKKVFEFLGLKKLAEVQWTAPEMLFAALVIAYSFGMVGYFMLIFMAGIERIPPDYYEAATMEGASVVKKFFSITLPLLKDVIRTNIVLWSISAVGFFIWSQIFSPLNPEPSTVTPMVYMYQLVFGNNMVVTDRNVGAGAAVGVILTVIVVVLFAITTIVFRDDKIEY